jgi:molybdopterin synthase sulfur carrier subunit
MTRVTVLWFASLRDARGVASESVDTDARDLRGLYAQLQARHGLAFAPERMRVAVDDAFARWEDAPLDGSQVAFIPPVSGG